MDLLAVGNLSPISGNLFQQFATPYRCVVVDENKRNWKCKNVVSYKEREKGNEDSRLYTTYDFEAVLYFSKTLDGVWNEYKELESIETILKICMEQKIHNFIYITGYGPCGNSEAIEEGNYRIFKQACEDLCEAYSKHEDLHVTVLKVPYLYSTSSVKNQLSDWIMEANSTKQITFAGTPDTTVDFLCDKDLGEIIKRIIDEPTKNAYEVITLSGNNEITLQELEKRIARTIPGTVGVYNNQNVKVEENDNNQEAYKQYGWKPYHKIRKDLADVIYSGKHEVADEAIEQEKKHSKLRSTVKMLVELMLGFIVVVLANDWTESNILLNFLDFRLVYIGVMGMMYGLNAGVIAAVLSCGNYIVDTAAVTHWQVMFYNVQNWLPFASYILIGTVSGYIKDKHENEVVFMKKEQELLEEKYIFLNEQYVTILENKEKFNSQIIGYQDSFGKLYSVVKKLDCTLMSEVFYEAISVIEDQLDNRQVAIYSINGKSDFARLDVCSKSIHQELSKSLVLSDYPEMVSKLRENKAFVNRECLAGYPVYATPIYKENELLGMILLMDADNSQMNMEFYNKFRMLSDLIKDSLIRAMEYANLSDQVIEGTKIIKAETFAEILKVNEQMREKDYLEYTLLRVQHEVMDVKQLAKVIGNMVRANDLIGMGTDGQLQLLLSQTGREDLSIISERMRKFNIAFDVMKA